MGTSNAFPGSNVYLVIFIMGNRNSTSFKEWEENMLPEHKKEALVLLQEFTKMTDADTTSKAIKFDQERKLGEKLRDMDHLIATLDIMLEKVETDLKELSKVDALKEELEKYMIDHKKDCENDVNVITNVIENGKQSWKSQVDDLTEQYEADHTFFQELLQHNQNNQKEIDELRKQIQILQKRKSERKLPSPLQSSSLFSQRQSVCRRHSLEDVPSYVQNLAKINEKIERTKNEMKVE